jgi:uncharacterized protein (UPF0371 family)
MNRPGFDNEKYVKLQSQNIRDRIGKFGGKLYLEFGGKLFDDYHASRVLPGFAPDSKIRMLKELAASVEIVIAIGAAAIEQNKIRMGVICQFNIGGILHHKCLDDFLKRTMNAYRIDVFVAFLTMKLNHVNESLFGVGYDPPKFCIHKDTA